MRRTILFVLTVLVLAAPAGAAAKRVTASAGGLTATLTYGNGAQHNASTTAAQLLITRNGRRVYEQPVPATGCFQVCAPVGNHPVQVASLYGSDGEDVILTLWTGGANCCVLADVYVPSSAVHSYVLDQQNFGENGFVLRDIGPHHRPEFISGDPGFYCRFSNCAESALPVQVFEFNAEQFINVTRKHPALIRVDAAHWLRLYQRNPQRGLGAIAAWAGDEDNLGQEATVRRLLARQQAEHHLTRKFVTALQQFLSSGNYTS